MRHKEHSTNSGETSLRNTTLRYCTLPSSSSSLLFLFPFSAPSSTTPPSPPFPPLCVKMRSIAAYGIFVWLVTSDIFISLFLPLFSSFPPSLSLLFSLPPPSLPLSPSSSLFLSLPPLLSSSSFPPSLSLLFSLPPLLSSSFPPSLSLLFSLPPPSLPPYSVSRSPGDHLQSN